MYPRIDSFQTLMQTINISTSASVFSLCPGAGPVTVHILFSYRADFIYMDSQVAENWGYGARQRQTENWGWYEVGSVEWRSPNCSKNSMI